MGSHASTGQPRLAASLDGLAARGAEALVLGCTDFPQLLPAGSGPCRRLVEILRARVASPSNRLPPRIAGTAGVPAGVAACQQDEIRASTRARVPA